MKTAADVPYSHSVDLDEGWTAHVYCNWAGHETGHLVKEATIVVTDRSGKEMRIGAIDGPVPHEEAINRGERLARMWFANQCWGS
jgi:hypothetical protein